jgi:hypothetical protein
MNVVVRDAVTQERHDEVGFVRGTVDHGSDIDWYEVKMHHSGTGTLYACSPEHAEQAMREALQPFIRKETEQ